MRLMCRHPFKVSTIVSMGRRTAMKANPVTPNDAVRPNVIPARGGTNPMGTRIVWLLALAAALTPGLAKGYTVTISDPGSSGTVSPSPGAHVYAGGTVVSIQATPALGYQFAWWDSSGGVTVTNRYSNSTTMKVTGNGTLYAAFSHQWYVTLVVCTPTNGTVSPTPGSHTYADQWEGGTYRIPTIVIEATPAPGYRFKQWKWNGNAKIDLPHAARTTLILEDINGSTVTLCPEFETSSPTPLAHWKLDESTGMVANDAVGAHHGTVKGNPVWQPSGGKIAGALRFDGVGDYVDCGNDPAFNLTDKITVAAWIKVDAFDKGWQALVGKGDSAWRIQRDAYTNAIEFACDSLSIGGVYQLRNVLGNIPVNDGNWHHVAGTYDGARLCVYVDGVLDASLPAQGPIATNNYSVRIAENSEQRGRYWKGLIDDVLIYNAALSESQINGVMTGSDTLLPLGIESRDIGTTVAGSNFCAGGVYTIVADGMDIWGQQDAFRYVYMPVTGDFEFSARVRSLENTDPWAKAGIMVRETLDPGSRHAFMCVTPEDGEGRFAFQCRPVTQGFSTSLHSNQDQVSYPTNTWLKMKRQGNTFTALTSQNGIVWTPFAGAWVDLQGYSSAPNPVTINMPQTVCIGLAVTSHSDGQLCTAEFDNVPFPCGGAATGSR
jgi:hypothetical protein